MDFLKYVVLLSLGVYAKAQPSPGNVLDLIDPLIGTINGGHAFPGATLPFGMVKAGADTDGENQGGFDSKSTFVRGFSHMHDSGTGGAASMGNFPLFVYASCPGDDIKNCKLSNADRGIPWVKGSAKAHPGYFSIDLEDSVSAETTVSPHSALYRFTFPQPSDPLSPLVLVDLMDLPQSRNHGMASVDQTSGRMTGNGTFSPSFGTGTYDMHFCIDFRGASVRQVGSFLNNSAQTSTSIETRVSSSTSAGTFVRFDAPDKELLARVGISFKSVEQACANAEKEIPKFDFDRTRKAAEDAWKEKLSVIELDAGGADKDFEVIFWSGIYRSMISPQDYTGENHLWDSDKPYYDSFYCIWDSFRIVHPLITILDPASQTRMVQTLIDVYKHEGYLPDCRMSLCKGWTQGGSNADVVLADFYVKGLTGVDWETGYEAVVKDAEVEPANFDVEGRGGVESWKTCGYIPKNDISTGSGLRTRSVSRTVEYAYNDFCIAEMAKGMGHEADAAKYMKRAENWKNLFLANQTSSINGTDTGFVGFLQPRNRDGSWAYQDPIRCSPLLGPDTCYLNPGGGESYEGSIWMYTFYVPQDMASLIDTLGGPKQFVKRLDYLHESGILYMGNEPSFLPGFQYHYAGRPGLSAHRTHTYIPSQFNNSVGGIPGNDDSGAMGSYIALSMIGLYPVAGQDVYLINPPFFKEMRIRNGLTGKVATIRNVNFDPQYRAIYIQSAKRDGKPWTRNWIGHDFFTEGGTLELELGVMESDWGTKKEDLPPSMSEYK